MVTAVQRSVAGILHSYTLADAAGEEGIGRGAMENWVIGSRANEQLWLRNEKLAQAFLRACGVNITERIVHGTWVITEDGRRIAAAVVAGQIPPHARTPDLYHDATWYVADPTQSAVEVIHWPRELRYDAQTGKMVPEHKPPIPFRTLDDAAS